MATTQIKRLSQNGTSFVPITLSEAVVVNTDNLSLLNGQGITTLDKVLRVTLGLVSQSDNDINALNEAVDTINKLLVNKQDKLTPGTGITIENGVISATSVFTLYKIEQNLPTPSENYINYIVLIPSGGDVSGNTFKEYICIKKDQNYFWEEIGTVQTNVDLQGYVTKEEYSQKINTIEQNIQTIDQKLSNIITAENITLSNNSNIKVVVDYTIPDNLYDSMVNTDIQDEIIGG